MILPHLIHTPAATAGSSSGELMRRNLVRRANSIFHTTAPSIGYLLEPLRCPRVAKGTPSKVRNTMETGLGRTRSLRTTLLVALAVGGVLLVAGCEMPMEPDSTPTPTPMPTPTPIPMPTPTCRYPCLRRRRYPCLRRQRLKPPTISSVSGSVEVTVGSNALAGATISSAAGTAHSEFHRVLRRLGRLQS